MEPLAISPNGRSVLGLRTSTARDGGVIEVRKMRNGALTATVRVGAQFGVVDGGIGGDHERTVQWESNKAFVMQLAVRD